MTDRVLLKLNLNLRGLRKKENFNIKFEASFISNLSISFLCLLHKPVQKKMCTLLFFVWMDLIFLEIFTGKQKNRKYKKKEFSEVESTKVQGT